MGFKSGFIKESQGRILYPYFDGRTADFEKIIYHIHIHSKLFTDLYSFKKPLALTAYSTTHN